MKWLDNYLQKRRFAEANKYIVPGTRLLDIGCNNGEFFLFLKKKSITGIGVDSELKVFLESMPEGVLLIKDHFPTEKITEDKFDYISLLAVLEHIHDKDHADFLFDCYNYLSDYGKVIITVPSPWVDYIIKVLKFLRIIDGMNVEQHHCFRPKYIVPLLREAGFKQVLHKKFELGLNHLFVYQKISRIDV